MSLPQQLLFIIHYKNNAFIKTFSAENKSFALNKSDQMWVGQEVSFMFCPLQLGQEIILMFNPTMMFWTTPNTTEII